MIEFLKRVFGFRNEEEQVNNSTNSSATIEEPKNTIKPVQKGNCGCELCGCCCGCDDFSCC